MYEKQARRNDYLPLDIQQAVQEGALCYITGTVGGRCRDGGVLLGKATVAYQDAKDRVHANLWPDCRCWAPGLDRLAPGTMVRIVAEPQRSPRGTWFHGAIRDAREPVYDEDPASRVGPHTPNLYCI